MFCGCVFVKIDNTVKAFTDEKCQRIFVNETFEGTVDLFFVIEKPMFLIVLLRNGDVVCLDLNSECDRVFHE